jgi:Dihydrodipicolinate reductase, C-terminus
MTARSPELEGHIGGRISLPVDRTLFAYGVLKAALWAHGRKPGPYTMVDVLGLDAI